MLNRSKPSTEDEECDEDDAYDDYDVDDDFYDYNDDAMEESAGRNKTPEEWVF